MMSGDPKESIRMHFWRNNLIDHDPFAPPYGHDAPQLHDAHN